MMKSRNSLSFITAVTLCVAFTLISCGKQSRIEFAQPAQHSALIENTNQGCDVLAQEFGIECDDEAQNATLTEYKKEDTPSAKASYSNQSLLEKQKPLNYSSAGKQFPYRGSWRMSRSEVGDLIHRWVWSPEKQKPVRLLSYFDMVLLSNVARRNSQTPRENSPQRMQVLVRQNDSNDLNDWKRIHVWPISSGLPGGKKIATFTGVYKFNPSRVYKSYNSRTFDGANMYETMFLYHNYSDGRDTGVAIHGTYKLSRLGRRDSGGCIRLKRENSQCLYNTITGKINNQCLNGGKLNYWGKVPSFSPRQGEANPDFLKSGLLEVGGYRVMVAMFSDVNDKL